MGLTQASNRMLVIGSDQMQVSTTQASKYTVVKRMLKSERFLTVGFLTQFG